MTTPPRKRKRSDAPAADGIASKKPRPRRRRSTPAQPPAPKASAQVPPAPKSAAQVPPAPESDASAAARMREIEERLDRMIDARARERDGRDGAGPAGDSRPLSPESSNLEAPWHDRYAGDFRPDERARPAVS